MLDEVGLKGLSMRKLGSRLGVEAMSLYNHVRNKADLLDSIHEALLRKLLSEVGGGRAQQDWESEVRRFTSAFLKLLQTHPGSISLFASRSAIAPDSLQFLDHSVGILVAAGFSPKEALMTFQTLFTMTVGHALFHYAPRGSDSFADLQAYQNYPHLQKLELTSPMDPAAEFEFGLEALLEGLRNRLNS